MHRTDSPQSLFHVQFTTTLTLITINRQTIINRLTELTETLPINIINYRLLRCNVTIKKLDIDKIYIELNNCPFFPEYPNTISVKKKTHWPS